ncbi:response regulator [Desulfuromonas carbonis]|uniref:response regulator n=1 Tax=Desulfuromonas sp. DDH964 TaxID=1823759 RepID=UPI00078BD724|nr:response regulator [Desulfuromonas sp. DDH964]AMV73123.1 response receiver CheY associated with MCPs of class 40H [Desulfuromonas sp. DDH964]
MAGEKKVLLVDDHQSVLRLLETILRLRGYQVVYASDGVEGIEMAQKERPDLILLDVMMPNLDGFKACRMLKEDPATREIPVIFLSARNEKADAETGRRAGAVAFVHKPFKSQEIFSLLDRYLAPAPLPA